jgi:CheY-like chemotaxis protein
MSTILLIEDNELNRDMLSRRLRRAGYDVLVAQDGHAGLEMAHARRPDIVIMDLRLPDMSGWELARSLKHDPLTQHTPILALTAHAMEGDREAALRAGCDEYDVKPVDMPRLLEKVRLLLNRIPRRDVPNQAFDSNELGMS